MDISGQACQYRGLALFAPAIFFELTGTAVFALFGSAEEQQFTDSSTFG